MKGRTCPINCSPLANLKTAYPIVQKYGTCYSLEPDMRIPAFLKKHATWLIGLTVTLAVILIPLILLRPPASEALDEPAAKVPTRVPETDHTHLLKGPYASGPEVTQACLTCHPDSAAQIMATTHWTWESAPADGRLARETVTIGKKNQINNFCISAAGQREQVHELPCWLWLGG